MPLDILGIAMLYPTYAGTEAKAWYISDGFKDDPRVRLDENVSGDNVNGYKLDDNSAVRFSIAADSQDTDIGCKVNFAEAWSKGYVHKSNDWMANPNSGVEQTGFFKITNGSPSDNEIILKGPTGEHHSNTTCCTGATYNHKVGLESPVNFEVTKEMWHVNYDDKDGIQTDPAFNSSVLNHGWFGIKAITYIKGTGSGKTVKLEMWYNDDGLGQTWKKVEETEDTGGWGDKGDVCGGSSDQILAWGNARMMYRWDYRGGSDIRFRNISVREINPFTTFDQDPGDPTNPPTNTPDITSFTSTLKLQRHINFNDGIGCGIAGGGGGGGSSKFYTVYTDSGVDSDKELSDSSTFQNRKRIVQSAANASSAFYNKTPHQVDIPLKKVGTPATNNIQCKIWDSAGNVKATSATNIADSSLTTSYVLKTFDMTANTYTMTTNDRIGVEYLGTSSSNYVVASYLGSAYPNSTYYQYEGSSWQSKSRTLVMDVWT